MKKHAALATLCVLLCSCASRGEIIDPPCDNPAPLEGQSDLRVKGFIVSVHEWKSYPGILAYELGRKYGFVPDSIWKRGAAFSVIEITPDALARLRCDPDVKNVSFIHRTWIAGQERP
jgi:hypothetical protein